MHNLIAFIEQTPSLEHRNQEPSVSTTTHGNLSLPLSETASFDKISLSFKVPSQVLPMPQETLTLLQTKMINSYLNDIHHFSIHDITPENENEKISLIELDGKLSKDQKDFIIQILLETASAKTLKTRNESEVDSKATTKTLEEIKTNFQNAFEEYIIFDKLRIFIHNLKNAASNSSIKNFLENPLTIKDLQDIEKKLDDDNIIKKILSLLNTLKQKLI